MEAVTYPQFCIYLVLAIGIPLAFLRPFGAFLLALVLLTAGHSTGFNQTRFPGLGPFLNLTDACVLVVLAAFFFDQVAKKKIIRVPQVVWLMLLVVLIAAIQSCWKFGCTHETLRSFRWALELPIFFFLGANLVSSPVRARKLVRALLVAAVLAAIQHVVLVMGIWQSKSLDMETLHLMRTLGYLGGCFGPTFLMTGAVWRPRVQPEKRMLLGAVGLLFLASLFLTQTRSVWLAAVGAIPCVFLVFKSRYRLGCVVKFAAVIVVLVVAADLAFRRIMPGLNLFEMATGRVTQLVSTESHTGTRKDAFEFEMNAWWDGTLIFGRGLWFIQGDKGHPLARKGGAFAHLGYITYLSQLGLIGFAVYALYLPLSVLRDARLLWMYGESDLVRFSGLLGGASIILFSLMFVMSSQFLSLGYEGPGVLYGAVWALVRPERITVVCDATSVAADGVSPNYAVT